MGRVFVNVRLPLDVLNTVENIHAQLKQEGFTGEYQMLHRSHITVAYYGQVDDEHEPGLLRRVQDAVENFPTFNLMLSNIGEFENHNNRVIWVDVEPKYELTKLHKVLSFSDIDQYRFDVYKPHITLITNASIGNFHNINVPNVKFKCDAVTLSSASGEQDYRVIGVGELKTVSRLARKG